MCASFFKLIILFLLKTAACINWNEYERMLDFTCTNGTPDDSMTKFQNHTFYDYIYVNSDCVRPNLVFAKMFKSLNLEFPKTLKIAVNEDSVLLPSQFENLKVERMFIQADENGENINTDILTIMKELKVLQLINLNLSKMPKTYLKEITLWKGKSLGEFGDCSNLEKLTLVWWDVSKVPDMWLLQCTLLRSLTIKQMSSDVVKRVLYGAYSVTELTLYKCNLLQLTSFLLEDQKSLRKLTVHHNRIKFISFSETLPRLQDVDLSYNELNNCEEVASMLAWHSKNLVNFTVANNKVLDLCQQEELDHQFMIYDGSNIPTMKRLSFANTATTELCFDGMLNVESLEYFDLSNNRIPVLQFQKLPLSGANYLKEINLEGTDIRDVFFDNIDYNIVCSRDREGLKISGLTLSLQCDCSYAWLAHGMRDKCVSLTAFCQDVPLELVSPETLECDKFGCEECICRQSWKDGTISAQCDGQQTRIPQIVGLKRLFAPGNLIGNISVNDLPETLVELDLRDNHISKLDANAVTTLFNISERRVRLAGNPIDCSCDNVPFIEGLKDHRDQVEDYKLITCLNDGVSIEAVDVDQLCAVPTNPLFWIIASFLLGVSAIGALVAALFFRYERQIKVFLFARGCCPWWLREEEIDADRPFDAFISFAHEDDEFVCSELLPELEQDGYRLCIHYRDWVAGEWIPAQIAKSVQLSRRTIIVLSKSFLGSTWGLLEFRMAHISTLKEGRPRIIAVMLEDVIENEMDDELKGYLSNNTYIKWGEAWFWDKLKYALPHKVDQDNRDPGTEDVEMENININPA